MKHLYATAFSMMCLLFALETVAQTEEPKYMVRMHEDNDFLNLIGGTHGSILHEWEPDRVFPTESFKKAQLLV